MIDDRTTETAAADTPADYSAITDMATGLYLQFLATAESKRDALSLTTATLAGIFAGACHPEATPDDVESVARGFTPWAAIKSMFAPRGSADA